MAKTPINSGKPWKKSDDQVIAKLVRQNVGTSQIAKTLRRSEGAIRSHVSQRGISLVSKGR